MAIRCALVGMPGSGKSTVGRQLAHRAGVPFVDLDQQLERNIGMSIREFFAENDESRFRDVEAQVLADVTDQAGGLVVSTGGGAVLRQANRDQLRAFGSVVYLRASPEEIYRRIKHDRVRPLLQVPDPLQRLRELHAQRDSLYRQSAHFVIDTGRPTVNTLVNMVLMQLDLAPQEGWQPAAQSCQKS